MKTFHFKSFAPAIGAPLLAALMIAPMTTLPARADDDDWEDRWEDYYEELEDRREEAEERWEERQERIEGWRENGFLVPHGGWRKRYVPHEGYYVDRHPGVRHYRYYDGPRHHAGYWAPPHVYRYEAYPRVYRYYGTPRIGYYDFGHGGAVRVGPIQVFWD